MVLDHLSLASFRNHLASRLDGTGRFNLLVGENGAGKTNVLEAVSLLAPGRGLRRAALPEMASRQGGGGFAVSARLDPGDGAEPVQLATGTDPVRPGRRIVRVNQAQASAASLGEWLAVSWLTPAMDGLFTGSAGARRRYMDRLALALDPTHARIVARHEAALRERNRLLAGTSESEPQWLDAIEAQLAEAGAALARGRTQLVERLAAELAILPEAPFARPLLTYVPGGTPDAQRLRHELRAQRGRDRAAGRTLAGAHRDELEVVMAGTGRPAAQCSTGEQKAMLIALTLAHAGLAAAGRPAVLLLDEIAAHLDPLRRAALFDRLRAGRAQVWLSGTEIAAFREIASESAIWQVSNGRVERL